MAASSFSGRHATASEAALEHEQQFLNSAKAFSAAERFSYMYDQNAIGIPNTVAFRYTPQVDQQQQQIYNYHFNKNNRYDPSPLYPSATVPMVSPEQHAAACAAAAEEEEEYNRQQQQQYCYPAANGDLIAYTTSTCGPPACSYSAASVPRRRASSSSSSATAASSRAAAAVAAAAAFLKNPTDDCRGHAPLRAWGCRRVKPVDAALPVNHTTRLPSQGRINKASLQTVARLPSTAADIDPIVRAPPKRAAGGHTFTLPYHQQYHYYKSYGNAGLNALSAQHHNFPNGSVPAPGLVYSGGGAATGISARDRAQCSEAYQLRYGGGGGGGGGGVGGSGVGFCSSGSGCGSAASSLAFSQGTQTPVTAVHYVNNAVGSGGGNNCYAHAYMGSGGAPNRLSGASGTTSVKAGNFGYGGGQRPLRAQSAGGVRSTSLGGRYSTSAAVIGDRWAI